jgi:hypothetical protein
MTRRSRFNENQLTLPFGRIAVTTLDTRVRLFWTLVGVSLLSLVVYIYAINATARHVAVRQELEREMASASASVNSLEFKLIELKNQITLDLAYEYGFYEVENPLYVRRENPQALTLNTAN